MTGQLHEENGMIQVRGDLWINPRALLFVEAFDDSVVLCLNGTEKFISHQDWAAVRPHIVTLPARAAGCTCGRKNVTDETQRNASSIAQAVDEIIAEEDAAVMVHEAASSELFWAVNNAMASDTPDDFMAEIRRLAELAEEPTEPLTPETDLSRLINVIKSGDFVVLDTETTGLYENAEICQISIIDANGNTLLDTLVKPQKPIPADATRIHGITNAMVKNAPDWINVNEAVWQACKGKTVIVYNADYDFRLIAQSEKACEPLALSDWHMVKRECAMLAYGEYRGIWSNYHGNWKWHKLSDAADRVGYTLPDGMKAHSALADCLMTLAVCKKLAGL